MTIKIGILLALNNYMRLVSTVACRHLNGDPLEACYLQSTWLEVYKAKLVRTWVNQYVHFGNIIPSRVKGIRVTKGLFRENYISGF